MRRDAADIVVRRRRSVAGSWRPHGGWASSGSLRHAHVVDAGRACSALRADSAALDSTCARVDHTGGAREEAESARRVAEPRARTAAHELLGRGAPRAAVRLVADEPCWTRRTCETWRTSRRLARRSVDRHRVLAVGRGVRSMACVRFPWRSVSSNRGRRGRHLTARLSGATTACDDAEAEVKNEDRPCTRRGHGL